MVQGDSPLPLKWPEKAPATFVFRTRKNVLITVALGERHWLAVINVIVISVIIRCAYFQRKKVYVSISIG